VQVDEWIWFNAGRNQSNYGTEDRHYPVNIERLNVRRIKIFFEGPVQFLMGWEALGG